MGRVPDRERATGANVRLCRGGSAQPTPVATAVGGSAGRRTPGAAGAGGKRPRGEGGVVPGAAGAGGKRPRGEGGVVESALKKTNRGSGGTEQFNGPWQEIKDGNLEGIRKKLQSVETQRDFWDERDPVGANPLHLAVLYSKSNCTPAEGGTGQKARVAALANKVDDLEHSDLLEASRGSAVAAAADTIQEGGRAGGRGRGFKNRALGWEEKEEHDCIAIEIWKQKQLAHLRTEGYERFKGSQVSPRKQP